ncbi:MAG: hypothetical protein AB7G13_32475 [Lautropia sp.]
MKIRLYSIWSIVPVPVITLQRMPGRLVGLCLGPLVVVRDDYAQDWPTIVHELTHCRQFWRGFALLHLLRYYASRRYRLKAELEAFRAEIDACRPAQRRERLHESARSLATSYSLGLDFATCELLLASQSEPAAARGWDTAGAGDVIESVPAVVPARVERRLNRSDRRCTPPLPAQLRPPEHNRRRQIDRRAPGRATRASGAARHAPS